MEEEFNNYEIEKIEQNNSIESPNKQKKFISARKRRELINSSSDSQEKVISNKPLQKIINEESKEEDTVCVKGSIKSKYIDNKFNTIDHSNVNGTTIKDKSALQEKLKKIFMNRDKLKYQYTKQDIPDNLKYHSDESESSEISGLKKSKINKNNNSTKKNEANNPIMNSNRESRKSSNMHKNSNFSNNSNNQQSNTLKNSDLVDGSTFHPQPTTEFQEEEKTIVNSKTEGNEFIFKKQESHDKRKLSSYNIDEEEKIKSKEKNNKYERGITKLNNNKYNNNEEEKDQDKGEEEKEQQNITKKESDKKNILLKMFEKREKKYENNERENNIDNNENIIKPNNERKTKNEEDLEKKEKKQKLLKLLFEKKESNTIEANENDEDNEEDTPKNEIDIEKENRRRKIIEQLQSESNNPSSIRKSNYHEKSNKKEKNSIKKEEEEEENDIDKENDNDAYDEKGTLLSNRYKNRLNISLKQNNKLFKRISSSPTEDKNKNENKNNKKNSNEEEENIKKNNKTNVLLDIFKKLEKSKEQNLIKKQSKEEKKNKTSLEDDINEAEIEKEAERIRKKEKKMEERRMAREKGKCISKNEKKEDDNNKNLSCNKNNYVSQKRFYNYQNKYKSLENKKNDFEKDNKKEEIKNGKKLEEEINEFNKEDDSTVNNSKSNLINSSNTQITQAENEDKNFKKLFNVKPFQARNTVGNYKNINNENTGPNEIILNDIPMSNLDRSFDTTSTYMKRKIPSGKNTLNIYRPRKPGLKIRTLEENFNHLIENNSNSFNPNQNITFNNLISPHNIPSKITYIKKKSSFNDNSSFILNNRSFCEYPKENTTQNYINDKKDINLDIDLAGTLNSSFEAYMKMNLNNNNYMDNTNSLYHETEVNNGNNRIYNRGTHIPFNNYNNKDYSNNIYNKGNITNKNSNKSYAYINQNIFNNNKNNNNSFNNNKINNNIKNKIENNKKNSYFALQKKKFITYNNNTKNSNNYINSPLKTFTNQSNINIQNDNFNNNHYPNSPCNKNYDPTKIRNSISSVNSDKYMNNKTSYGSKFKKDTSINIEDLMVLEEKLNEIIITLNKNHSMNNECFEFWNYYYNCSFYGKLEKLFKKESDSKNVQISINHILISVMICYDFSFEMDVLKNEYSILDDILQLNHRNLIIIYEHILSKISSESKSNPWVFKLRQLINNFNKKDDFEYTPVNGRQLSKVEKINYNVSVIIQNIRALLKNYKTKRNEYLTSIFKKINEKTYEEINSFFRDNILRVDNVKGSVLASVFLKENKSFQTEPAPYLKTKNRKKYSLILDLDETLVHFKINNEDDSEGVLQIRPGVIPFLEQVGKYYELIVFTAATQDYGDLLIDAIEENNLYFEQRLYRQHTVIIGNDFVKDLNRIGRPLDKIIIVDNMPQNFRLQKENGINIKAFWGEDADDNALEELGKILINIAEDGGDVRIGLEKYRDEIVKKVTSNISKYNY